jgi:predicted ABC-type transport system involved in lysophospholipase L1 biosynthesis ATPase subunit
MLIEVDQSVPPFQSYAADRTRGLYNVEVEDGQRFQLAADVPVERDDWQIGVVVGPSGSGKSSILRALDALPDEESWSEVAIKWDGTPVIEALNNYAAFVGAPDPYAKATASLAAVGLGSVPSWLRPRSVLSMGEGFRADMAWHLIAESDGARLCIDEFTSVLDRQVAKVGAGAFAKAWRRTPGRRVILFTCHYDVLDWVQPDWWIDTAEGLDEFASDRGVIVARKGDFQAASHRARYRRDRVATLEC